MPAMLKIAKTWKTEIGKIKSTIYTLNITLFKTRHEKNSGLKSASWT